MLTLGPHGSASPKGESLQYFGPVIPVFKLFHLRVCGFPQDLVSGRFGWCLLAVSQSHILAVICEDLRLGYFLANRFIMLGSLLPCLTIPLCTTSLTCLTSRICCIDFFCKACPEGQLSFNQDTERDCFSRTINIFLEMINELPINQSSCRIHLRSRPSDLIYPFLAYLCVWKLSRCKQRTNHSEAAAEN